VPQIAEMAEKGDGIYINQPTNWVTVVCSGDESGALCRPLSTIYVTTCQ